MAIRGKYRHKRDDKDRVFLPKVVKSHLESLGVQELVCVDFSDHVSFFTPDAWDRQKAALDGIISDSELRQAILATEQHLAMQKFGRVVLPKTSRIVEEDVREVVIELHDDFFKIEPYVPEPPREQVAQLALFSNVFPDPEPIVKARKKPERLRAPHLPFSKVPISHIRFDDTTFLCRDNLDANELAESIKEHGQQVPVILRGKGPYTIISGFRRITAMKMIGLSNVVAQIHDKIDDFKAHAISLIENAQRKSLDEYELIRTLDNMKRIGYSTRELAGLIGKGRRIVELYLQVWSGPDELKQALKEGRISISMAINAVSRGLAVDQIEGKSVRQVLQEAQPPDSFMMGPIYFRSFQSGRISLKLNFDRKTDDIDSVIDNLEKIIGELRSKREQLIPQPDEPDETENDDENDEQSDEDND